MKDADLYALTRELEDITPDPYEKLSSLAARRVMYADLPGTGYLRIVTKAGGQLLTAMWHSAWCAFDYDLPVVSITPEQMTQLDWSIASMGLGILHSLLDHYEGGKYEADTSNP